MASATSTLALPYLLACVYPVLEGLDAPMAVRCRTVTDTIEACAEAARKGLERVKGYTRWLVLRDLVLMEKKRTRIFHKHSFHFGCLRFCLHKVPTLVSRFTLNVDSTIWWALSPRTLRSDTDAPSSEPHSRQNADVRSQR